MRYEDIALPPPGVGEARVRQSAIGINFSDINVRRGSFYIARPQQFPLIPGNEAAGVVESVGAGVTDVRPGDRVAYAGMRGEFFEDTGAYAEERNVPVERLVKLPDAISDRQAAAMMVKGLTASMIINRVYRPQPGDAILVHAAAGGVGLILCQWAKHLGATVIGTVSSDEKAAVARAHGCDHAIVYTREDFADRVREITAGEGVPVVYDSVGKATFEGSLKCLRRRGVMASFGEASGDPDPVPPRRLGALGSIYLTHPSVSNYTVTREELLATANDLFAMVGSGKIKIEISKAYALKDAARAHADMEERKTTGSIVLVV